MMAAPKRKPKARKARSSTFYVACLNIVLHPHTKDKYVHLLSTIYRNKLDAKVRGDDAIMIGSFYHASPAGDKNEFYTGNIYKYLKLDAAEDWFNTMEMDAASKEDVKGILIPEHLKPHFKKFQYVFFPENHRLYFITTKKDHSLSPQMVKRFFEVVATRAEIAEFGELTTTVQPEKGITEEFFSIDRISIIELEIHKPNPDDHDDFEEDVMERLKELNAGKEKRQYSEASNSGLKPDKQLKALASVAAENGEVYVKGRTGGKVVELSTKDRPLKSSTSYNPDLQSELDALLEKAEQLHREITRRNVN
jgi:hypothetical protein